MKDEVKMPEPKYVAKRSQSGEWLELCDAGDWSVEMWAYGTDYVYTADQLRAYADARCAKLREDLEEASATIARERRQHEEMTRGLHRAAREAVAERDELQRQNDEILARNVKLDKAMGALEAERDALAEKVKALQIAISEHNDGLTASCDAIAKTRPQMCAHYKARGRKCHDCPRDYAIDDAIGAEESDS